MLILSIHFEAKLYMCIIVRYTSSFGKDLMNIWGQWEVKYFYEINIKRMKRYGTERLVVDFLAFI